MKSKDQILLESAVNKVLLKEDIMNNSTFDEPAMQPKQNERADYAPEPTFDWTGSDKELHNILNLEIDKVKTKLKDIAVKSNRG